MSNTRSSPAPIRYLPCEARYLGPADSIPVGSGFFPAEPRYKTTPFVRTSPRRLPALLAFTMKRSLSDIAPACDAPSERSASSSSASSRSSTDKTSDVWLYFDDTSAAAFTCVFCGASLARVGDSGTTNLRKHLIETHKIAKERLGQAANGISALVTKRGASSAPITSFFHPKNSSAPLVSKATFDTLLLRVLVAQQIPFNFVDSPLVQEFFRTISGHQLPHRTTLSRRVPALYDELVTAVKDRLSAAQAASLQYDFWTASHTTDSYGSVMVGIPRVTTSPAGLLSSSIEMITLGARKVEQSHKSVDLQAWMLEVLGRFNLSILSPPPSSPTLFACTIDMASNSRLSAELLGLVYIPCFAHTLNLCLQAAVASVPPLVEFLASLKDFTKLLNKSYKATALLRLCIDQSRERVLAAFAIYKPQRNREKALPQRLIKPVATRWSSYVKALLRFFVLWEPIQQMLLLPQWREIWSANRKTPIPFDANTYSLLSNVLPPLLVFDKLILVAQGSQVMLGEMFFNVMKTYNHLKTLSPPELPGQVLIAGLCKQMDQYFFSSSSRFAAHQEKICSAFQSSSAEHCIDRAAHLIALSARFDPRLIVTRQYALVWKRLASCDMLGRRFPSGSSFSPERVDSLLKKMVLALVKHRVDPSSSTASTVAEESGSARTDLLFLTDYAFSVIDELAAESPHASSALQEVHEFWSAQVDRIWAGVGDKLDRSPLDYWKSQSSVWPHLSVVAQQILLAAASSAETERLFSLAGSICDDLRGRLSGNKTDQLVFCARNMFLLPPLKT